LRSNREEEWIMTKRNRRIAAIVAGAAAVAISAGLSAASYTPWSSPVRAEQLPGSASDVNTDLGDGCPIMDPYTNDLFIARESAAGDLDIWRAPWTGSGWGSPVNVGAPVNTPDNEYCPDPARGNQLFFVRAPKGTMNGDIYLARATRTGFGQPARLPDPINSAGQEWSPSYYEEADGTPVLFFSSTRSGNMDIYFSRNWGAPQLAEGLNTAGADSRPNVRRDGLEIVFDRGAPPDIYTAYRTSPDAPWSTPVPLTQLNTAAGESRASMSWDGTTLVFGRGQANGKADVYVASRGRATGRGN
jgi:hypothetical protein